MSERDGGTRASDRPGTVVVSLDGELAWGFHHREELPGERVRAARLAWRRLIDLFDEFDVPTTWAVTTHLLLDSCADAHERHPAGERPCATGTDAAEPSELWFGRDLVAAVRDAAVDHELACHGHTHVQFRPDRMDATLAARELEASRAVADDHGIDLKSFVYPVNRVGYRDLLAERGFDCYRGLPAGYGTRRFRLRKVATATLGRPVPPVVTPRRDEYGLVDVPASLYLFNFEGRARSLVDAVGRDPVVRQATAGLDRAAEDGGVFHVWLHPHNARNEADFARLRAVLERVERHRAAGDLRVETMADVAARTRATAREDADARTRA